MTPMQTLEQGCKQYLANSILELEDERQFALAQADKCRKRCDCQGVHKWMKQAHHYIMQSMKETAADGIQSDARYADILCAKNLVERIS